MVDTALVTGATGSIGRAIVDQLADGGLDVILTSRSSTRLGVAVRQVQDNHPAITATSANCDVTDPAAVAGLFESIASTGNRLAVLVNCAGVSGGGITSDVSNEYLKPDAAALKTGPCVVFVGEASG